MDRHPVLERHTSKVMRHRNAAHEMLADLAAAPPHVKGGLAVGAALFVLLMLYLTVKDHDILFVIAESAHAIGLVMLSYKLWQRRSCSGISLKSQELTAIFLGVRLFCSLMMEFDLHTFLDFATLAFTLWVIYMMRFQLRASYLAEQDKTNQALILVPSVVLAFLVKPTTSHSFIFRVMWAFCVYVEAVSVLPQLQLMQTTKVVEPFTANYVFALGVSRFFACAHWILQVLDGNSFLMSMLGTGVWPSAVLLSEIVQTFILADFCYYYVKSFMAGQSVVTLPGDFV